MRLFEHPDFDQAVIRAVEYFHPDEYASIKADYDRISRKHFGKSYVPPPQMSFAKSDALFPPAAFRAEIADNFHTQCRALGFCPFPSWEEVQARLEGIRALL